MVTLTVEYNRNRRQARLSISDVGAAWSDIRQACHDRSSEVQEDGPLSFSMPWWTFLKARAAISFYVGRHSLAVQFDAESRSLLEKSKSRADVYHHAASAIPVLEVDLKDRLNAVGFTRELTDRQLRNVRKLVAMDSGATFSVPGAGKTSEALAFYFYKHMTIRV